MLFDRIVGVDPAYQIVATFGLAIVIQNLLLERYSADTRAPRHRHVSTSKSIEVTDQLSIGWFPLITFVVARRRAGRAVAVPRPHAAGAGLPGDVRRPRGRRLMGIDNRRIYALALAIAFATVALAGVFLGIRTQFDPSAGPARLIFAFEAVIIGGLGSLWGTLAGGIMLGVAQTRRRAVRQPGWGMLVGHLVFLAVLAFRPTGLFGKAGAGVSAVSVVASSGETEVPVRVRRGTTHEPGVRRRRWRWSPSSPRCRVGLRRRSSAR